MGGWVVVLEFSASDHDRPFDLDAVQAVVERLREWRPSGLYDAGRYAIQLHIDAARADAALEVATASHQRAAHALGLAAPFTRAEVLTLAEFEDDGRDPEGPVPVLAGAASALTPIEVYQATRELLGVTSTAEVIEVLVRFVLAVGGRISVGHPWDMPGMTSVDLSGVAARGMRAVAESLSMAGLLFERCLPQLIEDARRAVALLEEQP